MAGLIGRLEPERIVAYTNLGSRLLLIDDDPAFGRLVSKVAQSSGYEVVTTTDPTAFKTKDRSWSPSLIMMDLQMPGTDGIELLRDLAAQKCAATIILASGLDSRTLEAALRLGKERGLKMGAKLQKPITVKDLRALLASLKPAHSGLLASELSEAIETGELFLEYQPKLDCRNGRITGVEALVRWRHPKLGIVPPDRFIALAEEMNLIDALTDLVLAGAAQQGAHWRAQGLALDLAVNISAKNLQDIDLPDRLARICRESGIEPGSVTLELTETTAMRDAVKMLDVLTRLRLKGFRLSIDDFGTGYSSLVQLQRMPFSELKVDRSFVMQMERDPECRVIVEIVVELARKLGLKSVAEGVESQDILNGLVAMGCDQAQGYHLSRPIAADRILGFVLERNGEKTRSAA